MSTITTISNTDLSTVTYLTYKRMFDYENGTDYSKQHNELYYHKNDENVKNVERIEYNNGQQRNIIGNYNDNEIMIEKTFNHLNALKRSMSLSFQSDDETTKLHHENIMFRELLNLELSLRTMKTNIKKQK